MVIIAPIRKLMSIMSGMLLLLMSRPPTPCPRGVMAISAPSWKNPIPTMRSRAPVRNNRSVPTSIGAKVMLNIKTITVMGRTLDNDSLIFSFSFSFIMR